MPLMVAIMLAITIVLWLLLRHKEEKWQNIPFQAIALLLLVGEVIKQIVAINMGYDFWWLPLHFCSLYFIWFTLAEFSTGKIRKTMQNVSFVATLYLAMAMYSYPSSVLGGGACENIFGWFFTTHSFFFHHLVILYLMLSIAFKRFHPRKRDAVTWMICFSCYFAVATICAYTFQENFFGILDGTLLPVLEPIRLAIGQFLYDAGLGCVLIFLGAGVMYLSAVIVEKLHKEKVDEELRVEE